MNKTQSKSATELARSVFERYGPELHRYLVRRLRRAEDAGDLVQEVYLRLLRLERSELVRQPNAYLFFVAAQVVSQFKMRSNSDPVMYDSEIVEEHTERPPQFRQDQVGDDLDARRRLKSLLERLPPTHRDVLLLRKRDGLSWTEIAQALNLSVHTVKKYLHEARARIRVMELEP
jgi:RNA polymerase sigma-70 factor (ECF subfamily)